jgi:hypothetical protein
LTLGGNYDDYPANPCGVRGSWMSSKRGVTNGTVTKVTWLRVTKVTPPHG